VVAFLSRLVIVGADHEGTVGAGLASGPCQADSLAGAVGAGAGHDLDAARGPLGHGGDDALVLVVVQCRRLARGAERGRAVGALLDVPGHEPAQLLVIDLAVAEGRDQGDGQAGELFALGGGRDHRARHTAPGANSGPGSYAVQWAKKTVHPAWGRG